MFELRIGKITRLQDANEKLAVFVDTSIPNVVPDANNDLNAWDSAEEWSEDTRFTLLISKNYADRIHIGDQIEMTIRTVPPAE